MNTALCGLLLAGGKSSRMGRDKASLISGPSGETWAQRALGLLRPHCGSVYLSLRQEQPVPAGGEGVPVLRDAPGAVGPLAGILAALRELPEVAWLVLACDLPKVHAGLLTRLITHYSKIPNQPFLAYASAHDGLPEPLCAIYGPTAASILERHAARGHFCPRHILGEEKAPLLDLPDGDRGTLANINTPDELATSVPPNVRQVRVAWYGRLAEQRGKREETVTTRADTAGAFLREMGERQIFGAVNGVRIAVNDEFAPETHPLQTGDKVAILPPFAGG